MSRPPEIDANTPKRYHGYFENEFGKQAIFVYDYDQHTGTLWLGDAGWEKAYAVIDGDAPDPACLPLPFFCPTNRGRVK